MSSYSIKSLDIESEPFQGVILVDDIKEMPFVIENLFDMWFIFENRREYDRTKIFNGEVYSDALSVIDILPFEFLLKIKTEMFRKIFEKYGIDPVNTEQLWWTKFQKS